MEKIIIEGKERLFGEISIGGMKNSALPILFSCLLIEGECIIENVPRVSDIFNTLEILKGLGAYAEFVDKNTVVINSKTATNIIKNQNLVSKMRASSYLMGTLLARFGYVSLNMPGGCNFGVRPIEQHLKGFNTLGAICSENNGKIEIKTRKRLKSQKITLDKISVGATINMVLASVLISGTTIIENCAIEPHIDDLICFLNKCGAKIIRKGRTVYIQGVKRLNGCKYKISPDMIEALTYICFAGICGGDVLLNNIEASHLKYCIEIFKNMGIKIDTYEKNLRANCESDIVGQNVVTAPYPLFPTDLHPQFSTLLCYTINGGSVRDDVFPTRFAYVNELSKMGAKIKLIENTAIINKSHLIGAKLDATDLRAGAALVAAALGAEGISEINNVNYIVRGYENLVDKISSLGGKIKLLKGE